MLRAFLLCFLVFSQTHAAETTSRTLHLNSGEKIKHYYRDGVPELSENENVAIELAGYQLGDSDNGVTWRWSFTLTLKANPPVLITISDVTNPKAELIVGASEGYFAGKRWFGRGEKFSPNPEKLPWLFESGTTQRIFRLDATLADGSHKTLYQPAIYTKESKQKLIGMIEKGSIK